MKLSMTIGAIAAATASAFTTTSYMPTSLRGSSSLEALKEGETPIVIGLAADSGCGKSTFMRRVTSTFGGEQCGPLGGGFGNGGWETNTLVSDMATVICLDDYHLNDREGRKVSGLTALNTAEQKFDLMYEHVKALKEGKTVSKPIYNHVNGTLDAPEEIVPTPVIIIEGLHPFVDERVRDLIDFSLYLDISPEVKLNWKIQRDMEERGHSLESIMASIEARKPDFDAYIEPQKAFADYVIEVLPTDLDPEDKKTLKVRAIQKKGVADFNPTFLFDEGSEISWTPSADKLSSPAPGIKLAYSQEEYFGNDVAVLEMDGSFDNIQELVYVESNLGNANSKFYGEVTQAMLSLADSPGSNNGTGLMQTLAAFAIRELYNKKAASVKLAANSVATVFA
jgi:phosphoribulokinase